MDYDAMLMGCLSYGSLRKVFMLKLPHHLVAVFCAPLKVPKVQADFVAVMLQGCAYHFLVLRGRELKLDHGK